MNYFWFVMGIVSCIVGIIVFPLMRREIQKDEIDHMTIQGLLGSLLLVILGLILLISELSKII